MLLRLRMPPVQVSIMTCLLLGACDRGMAQPDAYTAEKLQPYFQRVAESYEITVEKKELKLRKQPLMNWKNPVRTQSQGALYVWDLDGRPQVLGSVFTFEYNDRVRCRHELISLAEKPLTANLDGMVVWSPKRGGPEWTKFDSELVPAPSPSRRLFQMRSIARQFIGKLVARDGQVSALTLIPQPLLRYASATDGVIDGGVFSLALGTDPEILLVIEAKKSKGGKVAFHYAPMRANYLELSLEHRGEVVWSAPEIIELQQTQAGQEPWASEPFFPMTPGSPLPPADQLGENE